MVQVAEVIAMLDILEGLEVLARHMDQDKVAQAAVELPNMVQVEQLEVREVLVMVLEAEVMVVQVAHMRLLQWEVLHHLHMGQPLSSLLQTATSL
ncbi:hypothetical protein N007_11955 [Alicyclobacillus acidoterrestris ATCC 49025]|nr:hypothetical protein N007_11955 [Alicyclobacillus acidoterrestris ATCC 49025]